MRCVRFLRPRLDGRFPEMAAIVGRRAGLVCVLVAGAIVFFSRITSHSLWLDEFHHKTIAERPIRDILAIRQPSYEFVTYSHGYYIINHYLQEVIPNLEFAVRSQQAIAAVLTLLFVYLLGRHLFSTGAGLLAAAGLVSNLLFVQYAQQNRFYESGSVCFLATVYCFVRYLDTRKWSMLVCFVLASSLLLRIHTYGMVMGGLLGALAVLLLTMYMALPRFAPYELTVRTGVALLCAAVAILLLWMPFPLVALQHVLRKGANASLNDCWWTGPFPVTIEGLLVFVRDSFTCTRGSALAYAIPFAGVLVGSAVYARGRALVFFGYCAGMTLVIIWFMNSSRAVVMPKRFLYLTPVFYLFMAGGMAMCARLLGDMASWLARVALGRWTRVPQVVLRRAVCIAAWLWFLGIYVAPEMSEGAFRIGQYYYDEYVDYRLVSQILVAHARRTDRLWWHPPHNDSWLVEQYLPSTAFVKPEPRDAGGVTRASIEQALTNATGLWLHNIDPLQCGFASNQFVAIPLKQTVTYLLRPEYLTNSACRDQDAELVLTHALSVSLFPHPRAAQLLTDLLLEHRAVREADLVAECQAAYHASRLACDFASAYFGKRGNARRVREVWQDYADIYFWRVPELRNAAQCATANGDYIRAMRYLRLLRILGTEGDAATADVEARYCLAVGDYAAAEKQFDRAFHALLREQTQGRPGPVRWPDWGALYLECLRTNRNDYGYVAARLAQWEGTHQLADMGPVTNALAAVLADPARFTRFMKQARQHRSESPALYHSACAHAYKDGKARLHTELAAIRNTASLREWPVYSHAVDSLAPTNWRAELAIPWARVADMGFSEGLNWQQVDWFEAYYERNCGWQQAVEFWQELYKHDPGYECPAAVRQCEIEVKNSVTTNVVPRLTRHFNAIRPRPVDVQRSLNVLRQIPGTNSAALALRLVKQQ